MSPKQWGDGYRTTMICIDSYENSVPVGRFYNQYCPEGVLFRGAIDLIKKVEAMLDQMNFPQAFSSIRSFAEKTTMDLTGKSNEVSCRGKLATFSMRVLFRQNTSWQGSISWQEGKSEEAFRSVLELLLLIDSAVTSKVAIA